MGGPEVHWHGDGGRGVTRSALTSSLPRHGLEHWGILNPCLVSYGDRRGARWAGVKLEHFANAADFYERAERHLLRHEACHSLILGLASQLVKHPDLFQEG